MKKGMIRILILILLITGAARGEESRSAALRERVDGMWEIWAGTWSRTFLDGEVYLPYLWKELPFVTWADEAPTLKVHEEDGRVEITFSESIGEEWRVCLGREIDEIVQECTYNPQRGCWQGESAFDCVYLISDKTENRLGLFIAYHRMDDFRPSGPRVEWEDADETIGFNCYSWGTTRSFQGGMYGIVSEDMAFYAEYDAEGILTAWYDGMTGCQYDMYDQLVEGEEPEDYVSPVVH